MTEDVKILRIEGDISALSNGQMGVESGPDADLDYTMWGGKDYAGHVTKCLAKDEKARVAEIVVQNLTAGPVVSDAGGKLTTGTATTLQDAYDAGQVIGVTGAPVQIKGTGGAPALIVYDQNDNSIFSAQDMSPTTSLVAINTDFVNIGGKTGGQTTIEGDASLLLKDGNLTAAVALSETGETGLDTTSQSIVGAINELAGTTPGGQDLQSVLTAGSAAAIDTDLDVSVTIDEDGILPANAPYIGLIAENSGAATAAGKRARFIAGSTVTDGGSAYSAESRLEIDSQVKSGANYSRLEMVANWSGEFAKVGAENVNGVSRAYLDAEVIDFQDDNLTAPLPVSETGVDALNTTSQSIVGSINEVNDLKTIVFPGICLETPLPSSAFSFDAITTLKLTITPPLGSFHFFTDGGGIPTRHDKTGAVEFPAITNTSGMWYFYFDASGDPISTQIAWDDFNVISPVYRILWNATLSGAARVVGVAWEAHPNDISAVDHAWKHRYGTVWIEGQDLYHNAVTTGSPNADGRNTCVSLSGGSNLDDNLPYTIEHDTTPLADWQQDLGVQSTTITTTDAGLFPVRYQDSGGLLSNLTATRFPFAYSAGNLIEYITSAGVHTVPSGGNFVVYYLYAFQDPRPGLQVKSVSSGNEYTTLTLAQASSWNSLTALYPSLADPEIRPLYKLIYEYRSTYDAAVKKAALRQVDDYRRERVTQTTAAGAIPASSVTHAASTWVPETNVQSALDALGEVSSVTVGSTSDVVIPLTATQAPLTVIAGTGSGTIIRTPNAASMPVGWTRRIKNNSSETIMIDNGSGGTLLDWILPGVTYELTLKTASAAGTWVGTMYYPDDFFLLYDNSFHGGYGTNNTPTGCRMTIGTGSSYYVTGESYSVIGRGGELVTTLGTDAGLAGYVCCLIFGQNNTGTTLLNKGKSFLFRTACYVGNLSDGTNTYSLKIGLFDKNTGATVENGVYLETDADGDVIPTTITGAGTPTTATGLGKVTTATWTDLTILVNSAATRVDFWTGKTYGGKIEATIPKTAAMYAGFQFDRSAGTGERAAYFDRIRVAMN